MSPRDQEIFTLVQRFCIENAGNRLNEWNIETLLNRLGRLMGKDTGKDKGNVDHDSPAGCRASHDKENAIDER